jgi:hypothetical protein
MLWVINRMVMVYQDDVDMGLPLNDELHHHRPLFAFPKFRISHVGKFQLRTRCTLVAIATNAYHPGPHVVDHD